MLRFSNQRLENWPPVFIGKIELPDQIQVRVTKTTSEFFRKVLRQAFQQSLAIVGTLLPPLLKLHDPTANLPVGGCEYSVDGAGRGATCLLQQVGQAADEI